jgi:hypothetical protein
LRALTIALRLAARPAHRSVKGNRCLARAVDTGRIEIIEGRSFEL